MTSQELYDSTLSALTVSNLQRAKDGLKTYLRTRCLHPQQVHIYDSMHGVQKLITVPCGKCAHCRSSYINEWVTRAYCHAESYKHVYYVTLTYAPIQSKTNPRDRFLLDYLSDAFWTYDSNNETGHIAYNPSCLVKAHYQKFLKRLRRYFHLTDLSYMVCGEYGHKYGRPHFHLILFSNQEITRLMCVRAWSLVSVRDAQGMYVPARYNKGHRYYHKIGNVDFQDLVQLGAFDQQATDNILVDGNRSSARSCFAYVVKYVGKGHVSNNSRVTFAYNQLYFKGRIIDYEGNPVDHYFIREDTQLYINPKTILAHENDYLYPTDYQQFCALFKPFYHVSLGTPIGSIYEKNHRAEHAQGRYKPSTLQSKGYITPKYFKRKLSESLYSLRLRSVTAKTVSFRKDNIPLLLYNLRSLAEGDVTKLDMCVPNLNKSSLHELLTSDRCYRDCSSGVRYLVYHHDGQIDVHSYVYDRPSRSYLEQGVYTLEQWLTYYYKQFKDYLPKYELAQRESEKNHSLYDKSVSLFDTFSPLAIDLRTPFELKTSQSVLYDVIDEIETDIFRWQNRYELTHNFIE